MRLLAALLVCLWAVSPVAAQPTPAPPPGLEAIVFLAHPSEANPEGWPQPAAGIDVSRTPLLAGTLFAAALEPFLGRPIDVALVEQIRARVAAFCAGIGRPFVSVIAPLQDAGNGVIQMVVLEGRLGALRIEGATHFSENDYRNAAGLVPGQPIDAARLERTVKWLNTNPYRRVTPVAVAGQQVGTTDIVLQAAESRPLSINGTLGNSGNPHNGEIQMGTSVQGGNAFGRGDLLNARYTTSPDRVINQFGGGYTLQLPWRDAIAVSGSYARTRPDARGSDLSNIGTTSGANLRYVSTSTGLSIGADYRRTDNDVLFGGDSIFKSAAVIAQFAAEYARTFTSKAGLSSLSVSAVYSPGGVGSQNTDAVFETQRLGATARYAYARVSLGHTGLLPWDLTWDIRATGQLPNAKLLSTEQLGLGGEGSVRGFDTFSASRDEGFTANAELRLPAIGGILLGRRGEPRSDSLTFFAFGDYGRGRLHGGPPDDVRLASAGGGVRYQAGRYGAASLAYGHVLQHHGMEPRARGRLHFQVQAGF